MSIHAANLWKYFHDGEIERFRKLLANTGQNPQYPSKGPGGGAYGSGNVAGSPGGAFSTSPRLVKNKRASGQAGGYGGKGTNQTLSRADVNSRDHAGIPLLGRIASSRSKDAIDFGLALIEHPAIDLDLQDLENGWTALHRALYFGNVTLARAIIEKDSRSPSGLESSTQKLVSSVIKVKDFEGNSPFDVYNSTIARQNSPRGSAVVGSDDDSDDDTTVPEDHEEQANIPIRGDEVFAWGSSKNYNLGFGNEDDRQYPEKVILKRPDHLLFRFYREYLESVKETNEPLYAILSNSNPKTVSDLPTLIANRPIVIHDVTLSKLHSAIITTDPESNLFMCGFGPGGRLGTGDEVTRFSYVCVEGNLSSRRIVHVALGHNHSLAIDSEGEIFAWGQNSNGVLGYSLPRPILKDEDPICSTPRQIFGPLKREKLIGVAASAIHSVAHTSTSLFTWGRNEGQLGLMDSDSRSLEVQTVPRKVAASLFKSPIRSVAAINRATIVLLENHSVCVFTNYGYNFVKFPPNDGFRNYHLQTGSLITRYDALADDITSITAAGDTIAAYSTQSLFTVNVGIIDASSATSTTNPSKIKGSLTAPQRVWSLRKGHWDGIKSASVTENGSVMVCTQAGAVWRRVKRTKVKDAFAATGTFHRKDFKFQRVPGLTNVAAVRSTAFGVYAAIRKDCDITRTQISINKQMLWEDISPMLSFREVELPGAQQDESIENDVPRFWIPALSKDAFEPLARAVLTSRDLEADISHHLLGLDDGYDVEICTTTSEVRIPVHGFMLGRSSILRKSLSICRNQGLAIIDDVLAVSNERTNGDGRVRITFQSLDFITLVNLVIYFYTDEVVATWNFTKHFPTLAFRYRMIRVELMKVAAHLRLTTLESAVRLMTMPEPQMDLELGLAIQDSTFFEDGDTIIELDGSEVVAHSALLCQRCPFFNGMFNGRSGGQWLAGRREEGSNVIRVDLKHIDPEAFQLVLRYLYADAGAELFDSVNANDLDEFSDLLMEVMAVANELMLDRLSQICQEVLGRFVNTRNACHLVNAVAPCSVTEFKDSAFEYICLQLESMLENHLLNDLDEELFLDLDIVVQGNQSKCLPYAKSGTAERLLLERNPVLANDMTEEHQRRLRDMAFRANLKLDDNRGLSSSAKGTRFGSVDEFTAGSPSQEKMQRKTNGARNEPFSPIIRAKDSTLDLMFDMEEDDEPLSSSFPKHSFIKPIADRSIPWRSAQPASPTQASPSPLNAIPSPGHGNLESSKPVTPAVTQRTWSAPALPSEKLGLSEIMAQASSNRTSSLSMSLSVQKAREENMKKENISRISQKERKRQQQKAMQKAVGNPEITFDKADDKPSSPWQLAAARPKTSLKDVLDQNPTPSPVAKTLATPIPSRPVRRTASPDTRFSGQQRSTSSGNPSKNFPVPGPSRLPPAPKTNSSPIVPHSRSYKDPAANAEPLLQLSMSDIIGQQRREQEVIKEAVAKRSLQEIQEEQAFQEWWDQECKRTQEQEEARSKATPPGPSQGGRSGGRGKGVGRGRGARGGRGGNKGRGDPAASTSGQGRVRGRGQGKPGT